MSNVELYSHQLKAIEELHNGAILCGGVGTGKSRTSLAYYYEKVCFGSLKINGKGTWSKLREPRDLYIITTAKKRDTLEWESELVPFNLKASKVKVTIDSWNNIKKYSKVYGAFFIFDEQRLVGSGAWVKAFYKIAKKNKWILLTATPGDKWEDYIPVFVANGFFKNQTDFKSRHIIYKPYMKYPVVDRYVNQGVLIRYRSKILVMMDFMKSAKKNYISHNTEYDKALYKKVLKDRWDPYDNEPIAEAGKLCYLLRRVANSDISRADYVRELLREHPKTIIFYNFTYELNILRAIANNLCYEIGEWNGEKHMPVPQGDKWVYLAQYTAAAEGWNCITTNVIIFYSQSYSYRTTVQAMGRIDRLNTPFKDLYYYFIRSTAPIDLAIKRALANKKSFNESSYIRGGFK